MFDGIGDFLGSDAFANSVPFVGPILNWFGQESANKKAQANAEHQMQFQEYMSNTAYQRAVKDLEKAGLNPMLAYMRGSAGAGGAAGAMSVPQSSTRDAVSSAVSGYQAANLRMQNKLLEAQIHKTAAETAESVSRTNVNVADEALKGEQSKHTVQSAEELRSRIGVQSQQVVLFQAQADRLFEQNKLTRAEVDLAREKIENAIQENKHIIAKTGNVKVDTVLKQLEVPLARNLARAEESAFKENYSPFLRDIERIMRIFRGGDTIIRR